MTSIAIINNKGGVGKTTIAVNLAAALVRRKKKVLLVDLDGQGNASLSLGIDPFTIDPNTSDIFLKGASLVDVRFELEAEGFDISPAGPNLFDVDQLIAQNPNRKFILSEALAGLPDYDYIIYDAPPALGLIAANILYASDYFIVPMQADYLSYEALLAFLGAVDRVTGSGRPVGKFLGAVFNLVDIRLRISHEIIDFVRKHFKDDMFKTFIKSSVRLKECPYHRRSIFRHSPNSNAALSIELFAGEILRRINNLNKKQQG